MAAHGQFLRRRVRCALRKADPAGIEKTTYSVVTGFAVHIGFVVAVQVERLKRLTAVLAAGFEKIIKRLLPATAVDFRGGSQHPVQAEQYSVENGGVKCRRPGFALMCAFTGMFSSGLDMRRVVPKVNNGIIPTVFITQDTERTGAQIQTTSHLGLQSQPARGQHPQKMAVGKH